MVNSGETKPIERPFLTDRDEARVVALTSARRVRFGRCVRSLRRQAGLSRHDLAERSGVPIDEIAAIECGQSDPALDTMVALANALDRDLSWLLWPADRSIPKPPGRPT